MGAGEVPPAPNVPLLAAVPDTPTAAAPEPLEPDLPEPVHDEPAAGPPAGAESGEASRFNPGPAPATPTADPGAAAPGPAARTPEQVALANGIPVSPAQLRMLGVLWQVFAATDDERRQWTADLIGRDLDGTTKNLRRHEAHGLIDRLSAMIWSLAGPDDPMAVNVDEAEARQLLAVEVEKARHGDVDAG